MTLQIGDRVEVNGIGLSLPKGMKGQLVDMREYEGVSINKFTHVKVRWDDSTISSLHVNWLTKIGTESDTHAREIRIQLEDVNRDLAKIQTYASEEGLKDTAKLIRLAKDSLKIAQRVAKNQS